MLTKEQVRIAMLEKLRGSGLEGKAVIKKLGFKPYTYDELKRQLPELTQLPAAGFEIPYFDVTGKRTPFFRYRYLEEPKRRGFAAIVEHKSMRYIQPAKMKPQVYFSPLYDWPTFLTGELQTLVITEGELKANCACSLGIPTLGLGGVWNFKSKLESLIPDLRALPWDGRNVVICYDSDARTNAQVVKAENELATQLTNLGASIFIMRLPEVEGLKKTGLDDFLMAHGRNRFDEIFATLEQWAQSRVLHELNEEVVFVRDPGLVLELKTLQRMSPNNFTQSIYANRIWETTETRGKNEVSVKKSAAKEWLTWPARSEIQRITYAPGEPQITERGEFNMWAGWGMPEEQIKQGPLKCWDGLLDHLFDGSPDEDRKWFEQWLAYPLQHPGTKLFSACVVWGLAQGTGKTLVGATMRRIYGANFAEIGDRDLQSSFNEWAVNKQFAMGDEIAGGDKRQNSDRMKSLITQQYLRVNQKYVPAYEIPDCLNYYFTSNHPDSFFLENDDRRYFVHEAKKERLPDSFYAEYDKWYRSPACGALFHYLLNLDLTGFNPKAQARATDAKGDMLDLGRSDAAAWVAQLKEAPDVALRIGDLILPYSLMTTEELLRAYDPEDKKRLTRPGMARELRRGGFSKVNAGRTVRTSLLGPQRLWAVRDISKMLRLPLNDLITQFNKERERAGVKHAKF